jgi:predicted nucleic acid-binding protein
MSIEYEGIFVDTNILIYSTFPDFDSEKHIQSLEPESSANDLRSAV